MADLTLTGVSGESRQAFDDWKPILYYIVRVRSLPVTSRVFGAMVPRGFWSVGQVGLGQWPDDGSGVAEPEITYSSFVHLETQAFFIPALQIGAAYFHSVYWRLKIGVVVDIDVQWTPP